MSNTNKNNKNNKNLPFNFKHELQLANAKRKRKANGNTPNHSRSVLKIPTVTNENFINNIHTISGGISIHNHSEYHNTSNTTSNQHHHVKLPKRPPQRLRDLLILHVSNHYVFKAVISHLMITFVDLDVTKLYIELNIDTAVTKWSEIPIIIEKTMTHFMNKHKYLTGGSFHRFVDRLEDRFQEDNYLTEIENRTQWLLSELEYIEEEQKQIKDRSRTIFTMSVKDYIEQDILQLAILFGLVKEEIVRLRELDIMRMLNGGLATDSDSNVIWRELTANTSKHSESNEKIYYFCDGLRKRYELGN